MAGIEGHVWHDITRGRRPYRSRSRSISEHSEVQSPIDVSEQRERHRDSHAIGHDAEGRNTHLHVTRVGCRAGGRGHGFEDVDLTGRCPQVKAVLHAEAVGDANTGGRILIGVEINRQPRCRRNSETGANCIVNVMFPADTSTVACTTSGDIGTPGSGSASPVGSLTSPCRVATEDGAVGEDAGVVGRGGRRTAAASNRGKEGDYIRASPPAVPCRGPSNP